MTTNSNKPCSLFDPAVQSVIDRVWALQTKLNPSAEAALMKEMDQRSAPYSRLEIVEKSGPGSFACPPEVGRMLYSLVRAIRPSIVLEFGTGHGFSTLHIAAALRDNGDGRLFGSEMHTGKVAAARANLAEAGLKKWAEVLEGDAVEVLATKPHVDLLYLDGWVDHYLDVLKAVEPNFRPGAFIQADDLGKFGTVSGTRAYLDYVRDPINGYTSTPFTDYQGFEQSCWVGCS